MNCLVMMTGCSDTLALLIHMQLNLCSYEVELGLGLHTGSSARKNTDTCTKSVSDILIWGFDKNPAFISSLQFGWLYDMHIAVL